MDDFMGGIGLCIGSSSGIHRLRPSRTAGKAVKETPGDSASGERATARSHKWVQDQLAADGFFGFDTTQCQSLELFAQVGKAGLPAEGSNSIIEHVRDDLRAHGYYDSTSSGMEKINVYLEPVESQTDEPVVEVATSQFLEVAQQMTAQTASLIQEQPDVASEAQARVFAGTAVKLLY